MDLVNICLYAEGKYSGSTYEENIMVSEEFFNKIKDKLDNKDFCKCELDGKFSAITAERDYQYFDEDDIADWTLEDLDPTNDGDEFYYEINDICKELCLDLEAECKEVKDWCKEHVKQFVDVTYSIPLSKKEELDKFVQELLK